MNLDTALLVALKAHSGQVDKAGESYILHPLRLMLKFNDPALQMISVLHDVAEDSEYRLNDLRALGFSEDILQALDCLTKREREDYTAFINRIKNNDLAKQVKIADIKDNLDESRLKLSLSDSDLLRIKKYHSALNALVG